MIAGHNSILNNTNSVKYPLDWSYDNTLAFRNNLANKYPKLTQFPDQPEFTIPLPSTSTVIFPLSDPNGNIGMMDYSGTTLKYRVLDLKKGTISDILCEINNNFSKWAACYVPTKDGRIMFLHRQQSTGKIYIMNSDGTNLTYIGQTRTDYNTNFGVRIYHNYDGTFTTFCEDTTNGVSHIVNENLEISVGPNMNSTYPYSYIKIPGYTVVCGTTGVLSLFNENMSTRIIANRTVSAYYSTSSGFYIPVGDPYRVVSGPDIFPNKPYVGLNCQTQQNINTSISAGIGTGWQGCFLPNGQYIYLQRYDSTYGRQANTIKVYDYRDDTLTTLKTYSGTSAINMQFRISAGKLIEKNSTDYMLRIYNLGYKPQDCPVNISSGPFGYNGSLVVC